MSAMFKLPLLVVLASIAVVSACGEDEEPEGTPTESVCSDTTLTYESFGADFMQSYCTRCHNSALSGAARNGAPNGHDFDTLEGILIVAEHVDEHAASGPAATNTIMPPSNPRPTLEERQMLGAWLACEVERHQDAGMDTDAGH